MKIRKLWSVRKLMVAGLLAALLPLSLVAQPPAAPGPKVAISLKGRHGHAVPHRCGCTHTGGGNIIVDQAKDDIVTITMAGVAVAGPHPTNGSTASMDFDLEQCFEIVFNDEKLKKAKLTLDATVVGLLRGDKHGGCAEMRNGTAAVTAGSAAVTSISVEPHSVCGCDNLAINDHVGPITVPVLAGDYNLHQTFSIAANHSRCLVGKASSAEFAPDPALDPLWISYWEPFHGAAKKDFGFKVIIKVEAE
jgi:hypothetical protein